MKTAIIGLQWGDEAKTRVAEYYLRRFNYDWSVKFNGNNNSGHTVYDLEGNKHKFHYLSSAAVHNKKVAIDTGAVVNLAALKQELKDFGKFVDLYISKNVHLVTEEHLKLDANGSGVGSTKKGTAYVYADRVLRKGKRITQADLNSYKIKAYLYKGLLPIKENESAVFEGSQGIMIDPDFGVYPYVTSSSIMPSMASHVDKIVGVMKVYATKVGDGPFYEDIPELREKGDEYGVTTKRPRQCTWNDLDQLDYAMSIVQPDEIVVTKCDILEDMDIYVWQNNQKKSIGKFDLYLEFLKERYPKIKYLSYSPFGDMVEV